MSTTIQRFDTVAWGAERFGKCPACGKRVKRSTTFTHTINPWNTDEHGNIKTRRQIWAELNEGAQAWQPDFTHAKCKVPA